MVTTRLAPLICAFCCFVAVDAIAQLRPGALVGTWRHAEPGNSRTLSFGSDNRYQFRAQQVTGNEIVDGVYRVMSWNTMVFRPVAAQACAPNGGCAACPGDSPVCANFPLGRDQEMVFRLQGPNQLYANGVAWGRVSYEMLWVDWHRSVPPPAAVAPPNPARASAMAQPNTAPRGVGPSAPCVETPIASHVSADLTPDQCADAQVNGQKFRIAQSFDQARKQFTLCVDPKCPAVVRDDCNKRMAELEGAQPTIVFGARDATGGDLTGVRVLIDDRQLTCKLSGTALSVDPGEHSFSFEVSGMPPASAKLVIKEGEKARRVNIVVGARASGGRAAAQ